MQLESPLHNIPRHCENIHSQVSSILRGLYDVRPVTSPADGLAKCRFISSVPCLRLSRLLLVQEAMLHHEISLGCEMHGPHSTSSSLAYNVAKQSLTFE